MVSRGSMGRRASMGSMDRRIYRLIKGMCCSKNCAFRSCFSLPVSRRRAKTSQKQVSSFVQRLITVPVHQASHLPVPSIRQVVRLKPSLAPRSFFPSSTTSSSYLQHQSINKSINQSQWPTSNPTLSTARDRMSRTRNGRPASATARLASLACSVPFCHA